MTIHFLQDAFGAVKNPFGAFPRESTRLLLDTAQVSLPTPLTMKLALGNEPVIKCFHFRVIENTDKIFDVHVTSIELV